MVPTLLLVGFVVGLALSSRPRMLSSVVVGGAVLWAAILAPGSDAPEPFGQVFAGMALVASANLGVGAVIGSLTRSTIRGRRSRSRGRV